MPPPKYFSLILSEIDSIRKIVGKDATHVVDICFYFYPYIESLKIYLFHLKSRLPLERN